MPLYVVNGMKYDPISKILKIWNQKEFALINISTVDNGLKLDYLLLCITYV